MSVFRNKELLYSPWNLILNKHLRFFPFWNCWNASTTQKWVELRSLTTLGQTLLSSYFVAQLHFLSIVIKTTSLWKLKFDIMYLNSWRKSLPFTVIFSMRHRLCLIAWRSSFSHQRTTSFPAACSLPQTFNSCHGIISTLAIRKNDCDFQADHSQARLVTLFSASIYLPHQHELHSLQIAIQLVPKPHLLECAIKLIKSLFKENK